MNVFFLIFLFIGIFLVVAYRRPDEFKTSRSRTINAPAAEIFAHVNDFNKWAAWSPWAKLDLTAHYILEGAPTGAGSIFKWSGNKKVGAGAMVITESRPHELIHIKLDLIKPMPGICYVTFTFTPAEDKTVVTWSMTSKNNFMGKFISMFVNCEKITGEIYEQGLENLAKVVEPAT